MSVLTEEEMKNSLDEYREEMFDDAEDLDEDDLMDAYNGDMWFLTEDEWEDSAAYREMKNKVPPTWYVLKVKDYTSQTLKEIDSFLKEHAQHEWRKLHWYGSCSYTVGIAFEDSTDAIMYKIKFGAR